MGIKAHDHGAMDVNATQVAHLADVSEAHALNATFSDTEVEAALDALGVAINAVLVTLETFGLHASS